LIARVQRWELATGWVLKAVVLWALLGGGIARAEAYPWVTLGDDVRVVADPQVDLELRLYLIRQARTSIDLALYEQGDDTVGLPILAALREAADRGVKVRVITQWFFQYLYHPLNTSPSFTTDPPTAVPIEYVVFGAPASIIEHGWHPSDGVHGKVLIVDRVWCISTGRGHADMNMRWIDMSNLMKGPLVEQVATAFDKLWPVAVQGGERVLPRFARTTPTPAQQRPHATPTDRSLDAPWHAQLEDLLAWLHRKPAAPDGTPRRGRLLHTDFVAQLTKLHDQGLTPRSWDERKTLVEDPVLDAVVDRLNNTHEGSQVRFTSMYAVLHPRLKEALCVAHQKGARITMYTNGDYESPPISTLAWFAAIQDLDEVVSKCGVELFTFRHNAQLPWVFTHLKLMVVDDTTYFGSHNLNMASSLANDEMFLEVEDPGLAAASRAYFDAILLENGHRASPAQMGAARPLGGIGRRILDPVLGFW
jgi:putative cardiolipin synthase